MEESVLLRTPYTRGVNISSGRSRSVAYHRDRISIRFYIDDVPLPDPIRVGLPEFNSAPLKKRLSWRPRSSQRESDREVLHLMGRIQTLAKYNVGGVATSISWTPYVALQWRRRCHPLRSERSGLTTALAKILSDLYKGEEEEFIRIKPRDGFSMYNPPEWVSCRSFPSFTYSSVLLLRLSASIFPSRN